MSSNTQYSSLISHNQKITIFDIVAQENLLNLFQSTFKHIFKWLSANYKFFKKFQSFTDELYVALHSAIEYFYLKSNKALFSEYFYGIKRSGCTNTRTARLVSILFSIVIPYLKRKFDDYFELIEKQADESSTQIKSSVFKRVYLKFYPYFHTAWSLVFWLYRLSYTFNLTDFNSPLLHMLNVKLIPIELSDMVSSASGQNKLKTFFMYLNYVFTAFLFFVQFLSWYQMQSSSSSDSSGNGEEFLLNETINKNDLKINFLNEINLNTNYNSTRNNTAIANLLVEPPKLSENLIKKFNLNLKANICPLCNLDRTNDCALSISGFVFCYPCIYKYVSKHKTCPITKLPCGLNNLIRIYNV